MNVLGGAYFGSTWWWVGAAIGDGTSSNDGLVFFSSCRLARVQLSHRIFIFNLDNRGKLSRKLKVKLKS